MEIGGLRQSAQIRVRPEPEPEARGPRPKDVGWRDHGHHGHPLASRSRPLAYHSPCDPQSLTSHFSIRRCVISIFSLNWPLSSILCFPSQRCPPLCHPFLSCLLLREIIPAFNLRRPPCSSSTSTLPVSHTVPHATRSHSDCV